MRTHMIFLRHLTTSEHVFGARQFPAVTKGDMLECMPWQGNNSLRMTPRSETLPWVTESATLAQVNGHEGDYGGLGYESMHKSL